MPKNYDVVCAYLEHNDMDSKTLAIYGSSVNLKFPNIAYEVTLINRQGSDKWKHEDTGREYAFEPFTRKWSVEEPKLAIKLDSAVPKPPKSFGTYGAVCDKCNGYNPDAEAVPGFRCYGCRS